MLKTIITPLIVVLAVLLVTSFALWSCSPKGDLGKVESITIGGPTSDAAALIFTAEDRHFFAATGINSSTKPCDTGLAAING